MPEVRMPKILLLAVLVAIATEAGAAPERPDGQVNVGASATIVCPAELDRGMCAISNLDSTDILFCAFRSDVTTTDGGIIVWPQSTRFLDRDFIAFNGVPDSSVTGAVWCAANGDGVRAAWDAAVR